MRNTLAKTWALALGLFLTPTIQAQFTIDIPGATSTIVTGINNADHIVGYSTDEEGYTSGFFKLDDEILTLNINGSHTWLGGINNNGMIVGHYSATGLTSDRHVFIYNTVDQTYTDIPALDAFDFTSANDINDNLWISGDLKNGANRRFFIWSEENGLDVESVFLEGSPAPTYGGHSIDNSGRITGYYIDGSSYFSFRYHQDFGYTDEVDLPDPESEITHKTRLMGANGSGKAVLDFILSDNCHVYDFNNPDAWTGLEKLVPGSTELHMLDINDANHIVGYYTDENYIVHGYADISIGTDFDLQVDGHAFDNVDEVLWNYDWEAFSLIYNSDPYWSQYGVYPFPEITPGFLFHASSYPGWVDFVTVMSTQSCYFNINYQGIPFDYPVMRPNAFNSWKIHKTIGFEGACFGMAANAGASWQFPDLLNEKFNYGNQDNPLEDIYSWGNNFTLISAANQGMAAQASQQYTALNASPNDQQPHDILNTLMTAFSDPGIEIPIVAFNLYISGTVFGHAVFPYAMIPADEMNTYYLYYYDPNATGSYDSKFEITFDADFSHYSTQFGEQTTPLSIYGMGVMDTQDIYAPQLTPGIVAQDQYPTADGHSEEAEETRDGEQVRVFCLDTDAFQIDGGGGSIQVSDGAVTNTIEDSKPWLNYGGSPQSITQFLLPTGSYSVSTTEDENDYFNGGIIADETIIMYHRYGTSTGEEDAMEVNGDELSYEQR